MTNGLSMKYFVLAPTSSDDAHALASRDAILTYAAYAELVGEKALAKDLREWMEHLDLTDNRVGK
jgi:hypothetical protein